MYSFSTIHPFLPPSCSHTSSTFEESKGRDRDRDYVDSIIESGRRDSTREKDRGKERAILHIEGARGCSLEEGSVEDLEGSF